MYILREYCREKRKLVGVKVLDTLDDSVECIDLKTLRKLITNEVKILGVVKDTYENKVHLYRCIKTDNRWKQCDGVYESISYKTVSHHTRTKPMRKGRMYVADTVLTDKQKEKYEESVKKKEEARLKRLELQKKLEGVTSTPKRKILTVEEINEQLKQARMDVRDDEICKRRIEVMQTDTCLSDFDIYLDLRPLLFSGSYPIKGRCL